jgi:diguanylate cyclase (GGDEF)-like protein/PAS domain S-box-containing protein
LGIALTLNLDNFVESRVAALLHSLPAIVFVRAIDDERSVQFLSHGCVALTGYSPQEICGFSAKQSFSSLIHFEDRNELLVRINHALETRQPYWAEFRLRTKSGAQRWFLEQGCPCGEGEHARIEGVITDISAQKQSQEQLQRDAFYDKLTGLPNRSLFMDRLSQAVRRSQRGSEHQFAILFLDLDRFKVINDSLGHRAGDELLVQVAARLRDCIRPGDTVARIGGDEFTMLIDTVQDTSDVVQLSERILNEMSAPFWLEDQEIVTTTSIGIALSSTGYTYSEDLIRDADIALYKAKALGKARYALFQPGMYIHAVARLQMENDLRRALSRQEFCLLYQPIIQMESGTLAGFEVFVYWCHPTRGLLPPQEFLTVAEETGMMIPLGHWVLRSACNQVSQWHRQFPLAKNVFVSINLSSPEISHVGIVEVLESVLHESGLNPGCLKLEITESTWMNNSDAVVEQLQRIKSLGIQLCIDDFGTGYSSLSYLDQLPVDYLKVDRSFVSRVDSTENLEIIRTILSLAQTLSLNVVAEGVETTAQVVQLRALRCELGQGFAFARPLDVLQTSPLLEQHFSGETLTSITASLPRLVIRSVTGTYQLLLIGRTSWTIGRSQDSTVFLIDRMVSREHAIILQLALSCEFYLVDLSSRNGSFINAQPVKTPTLLHHGDMIRIGKTEMQFLTAAVDHKQLPEVSNLLPPTVLMHQPSKLQGQIWWEVFTALKVSVIWQPPDVGLVQTLQQIEAAGENLPNLLLLDVESLSLPLSDFFHWIHQNYPKLPVVLTTSTHTTVTEPQRTQALKEGALDFLAGFQLYGTDITLGASDITSKVLRIIRLLRSVESQDEVLAAQAAMEALQTIIRHETLY